MTIPKHIPLALFGALWAVPSLHAATLYYDDFSGGTSGSPANLNGSVPDIGGNTWQARTAATAVRTDGTSASAPNSSTSSLPFIPSTGNVYTLSATIGYSGSSGNTSVFGGIGFFNDLGTSTDSSYNNLGENTPWIFIRGGQTSGAASTMTIGDISTRTGVSFINTDHNLAPSTAPVELKLILDTNGPSWILQAFHDNIEIDLNGATTGTAYTYSEAASTNLLNNIKSVGLSNQAGASLTVTWDEFRLDVVPEPSSTLLLLGALVPALCRRSRH